MITGLFTEILCILVLLETDGVSNVVQNYIGLGILAEIDAMFAESLKAVDVEGELSEADFWYEKKPDLEILMKTLESYKQDKIHWVVLGSRLCGLGIYKMIKFIYVIIYYYFTPFATIVIIVMNAGVPTPQA